VRETSDVCYGSYLANDLKPIEEHICLINKRFQTVELHIQYAPFFKGLTTELIAYGEQKCFINRILM
jgi:hypothetical protein